MKIPGIFYILITISPFHDSIDEINQAIYLGLAEPSNNTVLPKSPLYEEAYRETWAMYDPDRANKLLDELGLDKRDSDGVRLLPDGRSRSIC